jgi:hypothetical protein
MGGNMPDFRPRALALWNSIARDTQGDPFPVARIVEFYRQAFEAGREAAKMEAHIKDVVEGDGYDYYDPLQHH